MNPKREKEIRDHLDSSMSEDHAALTVKQSRELLAEIDRLREWVEIKHNALVARTREYESTIKEIYQLREKLAIAEEVILWASPCGQLDHDPSYEAIGSRMREAIAKIRGEEMTPEREKEIRECPGCRDYHNLCEEFISMLRTQAVEREQTNQRLTTELVELSDRLSVAEEKLATAVNAIESACKYIGVPQLAYPAPVGFAYDILQETLTKIRGEE